MTSSPHAPEPHRATARLDIWTVNVTEPVFVGCLSSREPVPAICRPAALLAHLCPCHLEPGMSETRSWVSRAAGGIGSKCQGREGGATTEAGESIEEVIGTEGSSGIGWLWCWVIMSDMMGGAAHLPLLCSGQASSRDGGSGAASPAPQLPKVAPGATQNLQPILLCNAPHLYISTVSKGCNQSRVFPFLGLLN